ncbi:MAG: RNA polymerase sigma factor [Thermoleophilia bacterium]
MQLDARRAAFEKVFRLHVTNVRRYARRRTTSPEDAEDVVAETFTVAWRRFESIPVGDELPWLYGVARHHLANQRRGSTRRLALLARIEALTPRVAPDYGIPESTPVLDALSKLRDKDRELLCLMAWEGLEREQLARALGVGRAGLRMRIHRARRALEEALRDRQEPASADAALTANHVGSRDV